MEQNQDVEKVREKMTKFIHIGIAALVVGAGLVLYAPSISADNINIARTATSAKAAAEAISSNNQKEIMVHMLGMASIGVGIALSGLGFLSRRNLG